MVRVLIVAVFTFGMLGCGKLIGTGVGMAGGAMKQANATTTVTVGIKSLTPSLNSDQQTALDPFKDEALTYETTGLKEVDDFLDASTKIYGTLRVLENIISAAKQVTADPKALANKDTQQDVKALAMAGRDIVSRATTDVPNLIQSGQALITKLPNLSAGDAVLLAHAKSQLELALTRLDDSQQLVRALAPAMLEVFDPVTTAP